MTDLTRLEVLAREATPGPWHMYADPQKGDPYDRIRYEVVALGKTITRIYYSSYEGGPTNAADDAAFIAAFSPPVAAALVEVAKCAEPVIDALTAGLMHTLDRFCGMETSDSIEIRKQRDALREALDKLKGIA
jgi:hypothetical protein